MLTRLSRSEGGGKSGGETTKRSASLGGLGIQQKTQVPFFWKKGYIFIELLTGACDRLIFNPSKVIILGNYFFFQHQNTDFLAFGFV